MLDISRIFLFLSHSNKIGPVFVTGLQTFSSVLHTSLMLKTKGECTSI